MPAHSRTLSKSDFKVARSCPTKLYYKESGHYASSLDDDPYLALLAQGGYMVEQIAKARYPDGVELGNRQDPVKGWADTQSAILNGDCVLFEATLLNGRLLARVDILERKGNTLRLIEVKAKSWDSAKDRELADKGKPNPFWAARGPRAIANTWREYLEDVTFQTLLLESLFPEFRVKPYLCLVDKVEPCITDALPEYFEIVREAGRDGRTRLVTANLVGDPTHVARERLTVEIAVHEEVNVLRDEVQQATSTFLASYDPEITRIAAPIGVGCKKCEYRVKPADINENQRNGFAECWGPLATIEPSILDVFSVSSLKDGKEVLADRMIRDGTVRLHDIPEHVIDSLAGGGPNSLQQWTQIVHTKSGQPFIGNALRSAIESAVYPLYFLDFEAARMAVPFHTGMRPYGMLAFQWSCHIVDAPGAPLRHVEWINTDRSWPNEAFARSLAQVLGSTGTVLTWSPYEASTMRAVRDELTERGLLDAGLEQFFELVNQEVPSSSLVILDMHRLTKSDFFYPGMGGRTSIKVVLDTLWRADAAMRAQFLALTGKSGQPDVGPYASLDPIVIAGIQQEVSEGTAAIRAYEELMFGSERHDESVQSAWHRLLLEYCKLDTLAMVLIWEHWRRSVGLTTCLGN